MLLRIKYLTIINITTPEFNKLEVENVTARLNQANLASKGDIAVFLSWKSIGLSANLLLLPLLIIVFLHQLNGTEI